MHHDPISVTADHGQVTVNNHTTGATVYRGEFMGRGWVEFTLPPGASFTASVIVGEIVFHLHDYVPATAPRAVK